MVGELQYYSGLGLVFIMRSFFTYDKPTGARCAFVNIVVFFETCTDGLDGASPTWSQVKIDVLSFAFPFYFSSCD